MLPIDDNRTGGYALYRRFEQRAHLTGFDPVFDVGKNPIFDPGTECRSAVDQCHAGTVAEQVESGFDS